MVLRISTEKKESRECRNFVRLEDYRGFLLLLGISAQGWKIFLPTGLYIYIYKGWWHPSLVLLPKKQSVQYFWTWNKNTRVIYIYKDSYFCFILHARNPKRFDSFRIENELFLFIEARLFLYISPFMNCGWRRWNPKNETWETSKISIDKITVENRIRYADYQYILLNFN